MVGRGEKSSRGNERGRGQPRFGAAGGSCGRVQPGTRSDQWLAGWLPGGCSARQWLAVHWGSAVRSCQQRRVLDPRRAGPVCCTARQRGCAAAVTSWVASAERTTRRARLQASRLPSPASQPPSLAIAIHPPPGAGRGGRGECGPRRTSHTKPSCRGNRRAWPAPASSRLDRCCSAAQRLCGRAAAHTSPVSGQQPHPWHRATVRASCF